MASKQPTPQGISALLKRAGFERSASSRSRIRGMTESSAGFIVTSDYRNGVEVQSWRGSFNRSEAAEARSAERLEQYAEAIRARGWHVETTRRGVSAVLIVTAEVADA